MNKKRIIVLGAGLVGKTIAIDLAQDHEVTSVDINEEVLHEIAVDHKIDTIKADLSDHVNTKKIIQDYDLVIGAVPGFMGFNTLKAVIEAGKNIVDISFFPEDPFELDKLATDNEVVAIVDCGVAPGMSNMIMGYHNEQMEVETFKCFVGGLPLNPEWPWKYKAVFSPIDVLEEYIRPARYIENGEQVVKPALTDPEIIDFGPAGKLEAFNTDGLRTLAKTMKAPNMIEKTLRYPETIEYLKVLRDTGYFDKEKIKINDTEIRPIDFTAKLLFPKWKMKEGEEDFTVMRVIISGKEDGENKEYVYDLYDKYSKSTQTISMARTTGYTCTAVANLILNDQYLDQGISPPEYIGAKKLCFDNVVKYLEQRNVCYKITKN
ncbi:MAG: saccharopine dehydrogenase NADP-binding domain-containing protein [Bacteroidia bacterium]|nr:saccharopine dehydrogenase NADP-binding domain-containing protein [Bacteroidia bacterium]